MGLSDTLPELVVQRRITRRDLIKGAATAAALGVAGRWVTACTLVAKERPTLRVMLNGGRFEELARKWIAEPFEKKYNVTIEITPALSSEMYTRLRAEKDSPTQDVLFLDDDVAVLAANEGLLEKLNPQNVPNLKDLEEIAVNPQGYGPLHNGRGQCLGYNKDVVKVKLPKSWKDLWNEEYRGMIVPPAINVSAGVLFVAWVSQLFGGDYDNAEPGFDALKRLQPNVRKYWKAMGEIRPMLDDNVIVVGGSVIWNDEIDKGRPIGIVFPTEGSLASTTGIQIVKGTKNKDLAEKFINEAMSPEAQAGFANEYYVKVFNKKAPIRAEARPRIPEKMIYPDSEKVAVRRQEWMDRWTKEIRG